ncbi:protein kinase domain-containing protein [Paenibacillus xerothermodurans]|uniref:non-specific serine/threonine protein kinase n=1 Tax=Paenibacillus xerothermodurans TaxID=1977292 RepID=A0A2W1N3C5_PAEXE|nr:serine/threonine protein kinase [Paenibacillus xerothermodurans]PZE19219.1 serine/threonine protein kinase [Paenibacillus xerothermodurans]
MTTSFEREWQPGTTLNGKWNKRQYRVERVLGAGANGKVYLVSRGKLAYALKAGYSPAEHQSEVNALKVLSESNTSFQNYLFDVDDYHFDGTDIPFYVMRYVDGQSMTDFLLRHGRDWVYLIGLNTLRKLTELHSEGYVFGDIKLQNMLVGGYGDVELIDFGGVTPKGRSVKQFTEIYDRGYWGAGARIADEAYDLFAFAVLVISSVQSAHRMAVIDKLLPQTRSVDVLLDMLNTTAALQPVAVPLRRALLGQYHTSKQALADWRKQSLRQPSLAHPPSGRASWLRLCFAASLLLFGFSLYMYW